MIIVCLRYTQIHKRQLVTIKTATKNLWQPATCYNSHENTAKSHLFAFFLFFFFHFSVFMRQQIRTKCEPKSTAIEVYERHSVSYHHHQSPPAATSQAMLFSVKIARITTSYKNMYLYIYEKCLVLLPIYVRKLLFNCTASAILLGIWAFTLQPIIHIRNSITYWEKNFFNVILKLFTK